MGRMCMVMSLAISLIACGGDGSGVDGGTDAALDSAAMDGGLDANVDGGARGDLFDVWAELQGRVRESPDHLAARADDLVAARDANAIFEFVRDEIAVVPKSIFGDVAGPGWGPRATLRSGVGTAHDKAQLLADLFTEAGFPATVGSVVLDLDRRDTSPIIGRAPARVFAPPITAEDLARWREMLGVAALPPSTLRLVDPGGALARGWADSIGAVVASTDAFAPRPAFDGNTPVVEVDIDGVATLANPLFADATLAESYGGSFSARDFGGYDDVTVRLWARRNHTDAPEAEVTLVEQTFTAEEITGRRVSVRTAPILEFRELLLARPQDIGTFLPVIEVVGDGVDDEVQAGLNAAGTAINLRGERLEVTAEGDLVIEGVAFPVTEDEATLLAGIASVAVEADAASFPELRLTVDVRDAAGDGVEGLTGRPFLVEEEGERAFHMLRRNTATTRVQLLFDNSSSVPAEFRGESAIQLGLDIAREVLAAPNAELSTTMLNDRTFEPWTDDLVVFEAQLRAMEGVASSVWSHIGDAQRRSPDLIILISDAWPDDEDTIERRDAIRRGGAPVLVLHTPPGVLDISEDLASLTGGVVIPVTERAAAVTAVADYLAAMDEPAYELAYAAPLAGAPDRSVRVVLADVEATTSYTAPTSGAGAFGMTGLYVTVTVDGDDVTRKLAGAPVDPNEREATRDDVEAVREALFATHVIGFEGAPPPMAVVLDEWLGDELTLRDAVRARDIFDDWVVAMEAGFRRPVPELIATAGFVGYDTTNSQTFVARPRPVLFTRQPRWGEGVERRLDLLPVSPWATAGLEPAQAWERTLERSLHMAAVEAELFSTSTASQLEGEAVEAIDPRLVPGRFVGTPQEAAWRAAMQAFSGFGEFTAVVPTDGEPVAFWAVHRETGTTLGVLADGSGGGYERIRARVESNLAFFDMIEEASEASGVSGGVWLSLELLKARIVSWATLWIGSLGEPGIMAPPGVDSVADLVGDWARGELEGHAMDVLPDGYSDAIEEAMDVFGLLTDAADVAGLDTSD